MAKQNGEADVIVLLSIAVVSFLVWSISKSIGLDMFTTLKEFMLLGFIFVAYFFLLKSSIVTLKESVLYFLGAIWIALKPALDKYANPYAEDHPWLKLSTADIPWYGSIYWQLGILGAFIAAGFWTNRR